MKLPKKQLLLSLGVFVVAAATLYGMLVFERGRKLYGYVKAPHRGWSGKVHQADRSLGFAPIPGAKGAHVFAIGPDVPMAYDKDGFRVPVSSDGTQRERKRPYILTLGCSLTYGDACAAEDTYPYKVARALDGTELNAGGCGYGLAQMLILARRLLPEHKPEFVIVQYSPWLVDRALKHFAPTYYSYATNPYFTDDKTGGVSLRDPVFSSCEITLSDYSGSQRSFANFLAFLFGKALPLYAHDDICILGYRLRTALGRVPQPSKRTGAVVTHVYTAIRDICMQHNAAVLVVVLGRTVDAVEPPRELLQLSIPVVNAHDELLARLPKRDQNTYLVTYTHIRGNPPVCVDNHPNGTAHTIIANAIGQRLSQARAKPAP